MGQPYSHENYIKFREKIIGYSIAYQKRNKEKVKAYKRAYKRRETELITDSYLIHQWFRDSVYAKYMTKNEFRNNKALLQYCRELIRERRLKRGLKK